MKIGISDQLQISPAKVSIDANFGPYASLQEAYEALDYNDALLYGLTFGIVTEDGNVVEHIIEKIPGTDTITVDNFKPKFGKVRTLEMLAVGGDINEYDPKILAYPKGSIVEYSNAVYKSNKVTGGSWKNADWDLYNLKDEIANAGTVDNVTLQKNEQGIISVKDSSIDGSKLSNEITNKIDNAVTIAEGLNNTIPSIEELVTDAASRALMASENATEQAGRAELYGKTVKELLEQYENSDVAIPTELLNKIADHEAEIYGSGEGEDIPDDPILPDDGGGETPEHEVLTTEDILVPTTPQGLVIGCFWSQGNNGLLMGTSSGADRKVSKRIKVYEGDTITFNIPNVSSCSIIVKIDKDESEWVVGQTTSIPLWLTANKGTSGTWIADEECYISFFYNSSYENSATITRAAASSSAASPFSLTDGAVPDDSGVDNDQSQGSEDANGGTTTKVSRITKLENANKVINANITSLTSRVRTLETNGGGSSSGGDSVASMTGYGYFGINYPAQVAFIKDVLMQSMTDARLSFVHISDTHNMNFGNAPDFTDKIGADFLVNTGDVCNAFTDSASGIVAQVNAMAKPCYLVMGNHDYAGSASNVANAASIYNKYYKDTNAHNGIATTKTYFSAVKAYSVANDSCKGVKSIFLDQYSDLSCTSQPPTAIMSQEEINWFIDELKDATTNGYHVVCFAHAPFPTSNELVQQGWDDYYWGSGIDNGCMKNDVLVKIVDAWMKGTSYSVTYNNNTYSGTFSGKGVFVGWFAGHSHCHTMGRLAGYPTQRCFSTQAGKGVGRNFSTLPQNIENVAFVSIIPKKRSVSIYNLGEQVAINGFKRDMITYKY